MNLNYIKIMGFFVLIVASLLLVSCGSNQLECTNSRGFKDGLFQQTWFSKPERKAEYIGAVFGDKTGEIRLSDKRLTGDYCIEDKTIFFKQNGVLNGLLIIEILSIEEETMVWQMEDGTQLKYYNPYPDLSKEIDLEPRKTQ
ncbi:hypothetical protein [Marinicella gelatinilytica]|uniref:hypothetical protein n=1 Tax=Marinicella gelatinilytica TaxID=2996017 RepID=UPI002260C3F3|nr:hypothetical protein [Marinicella gelatinilytica]MCX7546225.1 hypothetical protein [Marinicella gelatinilytica]